MTKEKVEHIKNKIQHLEVKKLFKINEAGQMVKVSGNKEDKYSVWNNKHTIISGSFELFNNSNNLLQHNADAEGNTIKNLTIIGTNSASEVFCIWQKDENTKPIVFPGEAGRAKVIAHSMGDFTYS